MQSEQLAQIQTHKASVYNNVRIKVVLFGPEIRKAIDLVQSNFLNNKLALLPRQPIGM